MIDEEDNLVPEKPGVQPQGQLPPQTAKKFRGVLHELEFLYVKALTPRPLKEAIFAGFGFLNLGVAFLQEYDDEREWCARRLQFIREAEYPKLRRSLGISADRIQVMNIESEGIKSRHQVPPMNSRPFEEAITEEILSQWYNTRLLSEVQSMAVHLMKRGLLRKESRIASQFKARFEKRAEAEEDEQYEDTDAFEEESVLGGVDEL